MTALDLAKDWLRYARSDLATSRQMFENAYPREIEISCFHAQQCAEKSLKAYLISKLIEPSRTHDLVELNNLCKMHDSNFSTIRQYCIFLNPYGVQVRYPNELAVDDSIAKKAIENAEKIFGFCDSIINVYSNP